MNYCRFFLFIALTQRLTQLPAHLRPTPEYSKSDQGGVLKETPKTIKCRLCPCNPWDFNPYPHPRRVMDVTRGLSVCRVSAGSNLVNRWFTGRGRTCITELPLKLMRGIRVNLHLLTLSPVLGIQSRCWSAAPRFHPHPPAPPPLLPLKKVPAAASGGTNPFFSDSTRKY